MTDDRFADVMAYDNEDGVYRRCVMDRETGWVCYGVHDWTTQDLNKAPWKTGLLSWFTEEDFSVVGEIGPVPKRLTPPFEPVTVTDEDQDWIKVDADGTYEDTAYVTMGRNHHTLSGVNLTQHQARVVSSAIMRAAGLDLKTTDLPLS